MLTEELRKKLLETADNISILTGADSRVYDAASGFLCKNSAEQANVGSGSDSSCSGSADRLSGFCSGCSCPRCDMEKTHRYGLSEALRWGGQYTYFCPLGLTFTAAAAREGGALMGGTVTGPFIMGDAEEAGIVIPELNAAELSRLPAVSAKRMNSIALAAQSMTEQAVTKELDGISAFDSGEMMNSFFDRAVELRKDERYPIEYEKQLGGFISQRNKKGAQKLLNELLGHIYVSNSFDVKRIRPRIIELIVVLSRATIDAGADIREIFSFNNDFLNSVEGYESIEELSIRVSRIMHTFINYIFDFTNVKHSDVVFKAITYIRSHYSEKITLDDIAGHVYLSRSYLSSVFREETGETLVSYINSVRTEKSKILLADKSLSLCDIAGGCGFVDQSYFTKVFKRQTGMSPKKYRDMLIKQL